MSSGDLTIAPPRDAVRPDPPGLAAVFFFFVVCVVFAADAREAAVDVVRFVDVVFVFAFTVVDVFGVTFDAGSLVLDFALAMMG